jgi:hypothetical protein
MIYSLKIKLNRSWNFWRNWNVSLVLLERSWWAGSNGIYLVRFGLRMWEILIFKWFLPPKFKKIKKKQVLEGKISWECGNTWRLTIQFKHDFLSYLAIQKIESYHCKTMFTCWVSLFCNGFILGPMAQATLVYLWRKVVCWFCFVCTYEIHWIRMLQIVFLISLESSQGGGVHMVFGLVV